MTASANLDQFALALRYAGLRVHDQRSGAKGRACNAIEIRDNSASLARRREPGACPRRGARRSRSAAAMGLQICK